MNLKQAEKTVRIIDRLIANDDGAFCEQEVRWFRHMKEAIKGAKAYGQKTYIKMCEKCLKMVDEQYG